MKKQIRVAGIVCLCIGTMIQIHQTAGAAEPAVSAWVLTGPDRALRNAEPTGVKSAKIEAARNEWEFFQIAVRAAKVVPDLTLVMSPLEGPAGARLEGHDQIRLYREHQIYLAAGSPLNRDFKKGWFPDALIPFVNPADGSPLPHARFIAVPFDLPPNETHVFLVEVYVPAGARPGLYRGAATLENAAGERVNIPVELTVWDFELPRLAAIKTEFDAPGHFRVWKGDRLVYDGRGPMDPANAEANALCAQLTTEHRINTYLPILAALRLIEDSLQKDGSFDFAPEHITATKAFAARYHVNALPVRQPGRFFGIGSRARIANYLRSWERVFEKAGVADLPSYTYVSDEPGSEKDYESVRQWGKVIKEADTRIKRLVVEQTKTQDVVFGDLYGAVDIWAPLFTLFDAESAASRRALGEEIWTYTALSQGRNTPLWHIDRPVLNYRAPSLIAWRYGITGLLYAGRMAWWRELKDPWTDPANHGEYIGEGNLLYPGGDVGFKGPIPSLRLKVLRSGLQDYDYLHILDQRGLRDEAMNVIMRIGPRWREYSHDPQAYLLARRALAGLILGKPVPPEALPRLLPTDSIAEEKPPEITVSLSEAAASIDGKLDKAYSRQSAALRLREAYDGGKPNAATTVHLARDKDHLYVFFNCREPEMAGLVAKVKKRDGNIWKDDCVEMFIDRAGDGQKYAHITVNPIGTVVAGRNDLRTAWDIPISASGLRREDFWTMELRLPFKGMGGPPKPGETWRMNFCRERQPAEEEITAWSITYGSFHNPERFGFVRFK